MTVVSDVKVIGEGVSLTRTALGSVVLQGDSRGRQLVEVNVDKVSNESTLVFHSKASNGEEDIVVKKLKVVPKGFPSIK